MTDFTATRPFTYVNGTLIDPGENNPNENEIYNKYNASMSSTTGHTHDGSTGNGAPLGTLPEFVPIGSIIPFYDFSGALTFNTTRWAYCNGQIKAVGTIGNQTLPDLSNRYLVGFGTEGGLDNGSAAWATPAVGNASHLVNLQHAHAVNSHVHDISTHTHSLSNHTHDLSLHTHNHTHQHTIGAHFHGPGTLNITASGSHTHDTPVSVGQAGGNPYQNADDGGNTTSGNITSSAATHSHANSAFAGSVGNTGGSNGDAGFLSSTENVTATSAPSTNNSGAPSNNTSGTSSNASTGASGPSTDSQLSTAQSIQPRSIRVRFIMRIL